MKKNTNESRSRKTLKSYFWEFLMLFLAVFCGFLAQWHLENVLESGQEKEFIKSMVEDAQIDTMNVERVLTNNKRNLVFVDSLAEACYNYKIGRSNDYEIYRLFRNVLSNLEVLKPTERTLLQLNNSGGMRLIRNKASSDIIIFYDGCGKDVKAQQEIVNNIKYEASLTSYELFNLKYYNLGSYVGVSLDAKLLNNDKIKLTQFANRIAAYGGVLTKYNFELNELKENAIKLIKTLRKEYQIVEV